MGSKQRNRERERSKRTGGGEQHGARDTTELEGGSGPGVGPDSAQAGFDRERRTQTVCLAILTTIAIGVALFWLRPVMIPFVLAVFVSYALAPVIDFLAVRLHAPRQLAIATALFLSFVLLVGLAAIVTSSVAQMAENRATYVKQITALAYRSYDRVTTWVPLDSLGFDHESLERIVGPRPGDLVLGAPAGAPGGDFQPPDAATGAGPDATLDGQPESATPSASEAHPLAVGPGAGTGPEAGLEPGSGIDRVPDLLGTREPELFPVPSFRDEALVLAEEGSLKPTGPGLRGFLGDVLLYTTLAIRRLVSQGTLVMIFVFFLLIGRKPRTGRREGVWGDIERRVKRYTSTKVLTSGATGVLTWLILSILGVEPAMVFGLSAFLLNFIPSVGSIISTLLPLPVVLFAPEITPTTAALSIVLPGTVQFTIGNVLEPKLMGDNLDLHPVVILLSLIFWGMVWGIVGMFLAVPITAVVKILLERIHVTAPMAEMMAGRLDEAERRAHI